MKPFPISDKNLNHSAVHDCGVFDIELGQELLFLFKIPEEILIPGIDWQGNQNPDQRLNNSPTA